MTTVQQPGISPPLLSKFEDGGRAGGRKKELNANKKRGWDKKWRLPSRSSPKSHSIWDSNPLSFRRLSHLPPFQIFSHRCSLPSVYPSRIEMLWEREAAPGVSWNDRHFPYSPSQMPRGRRSHGREGKKTTSYAPPENPQIFLSSPL